MTKKFFTAILLTGLALNSSFSFGALNSTNTAKFMPAPSATTTAVFPSVVAPVKKQNSLPSILSSNRPKGLNEKVAKLAYQAYHQAKTKGVAKSNIMTIIDYSKPSDERRLWVIDLKSNKMIMNTLVSHGKQSGERYAKKFSDRMHSHQTSIGLFVTDKTYHGHHGLSLRLRGLDHGFNANALRRAIVIHGASYVNYSLAKFQHKIGRSWGCPAVSQKEVRPLINTIKGGSIVFAYYPDSDWIKHSKYLA